MSKHGLTSLCIPGHDPPIDITISMDIHCNPGPLFLNSAVRLKISTVHRPQQMVHHATTATDNYHCLLNIPHLFNHLISSSFFINHKSLQNLSTTVRSSNILNRQRLLITYVENV